MHFPHLTATTTKTLRTLNMSSVRDSEKGKEQARAAACFRGNSIYGQPALVMTQYASDYTLSYGTYSFLISGLRCDAISDVMMRWRNHQSMLRVSMLKSWMTEIRSETQTDDVDDDADDVHNDDAQSERFAMFRK